MGKEGRVLTQLRYCLWMHLWKVVSWFYHMVFPVAQKVQWCHYKSIRYPSWWIMYVFCAVLSSLFSQGDYVLEGLMPETHYFLWLNRDPCTSHLEPSEKKGIGLFSLSGSLGSTYLPLNVHEHCWNSAFVDLKVWRQVNFLSALLGALLIANLGKQYFFLFAALQPLKSCWQK